MPEICIEEVRPNGRVFTALKAGLVCVCCYLGSELDSKLVYPQIGTGVLFVPYAILTATLLFSSARRWWIYLLASALGNYFPHRDDAPASFVVMAEAANFTRALLAAGGMRYLCGGAPRLGTLRGVAAFLAFAVVIAPFTAAFLGAGVVLLHRARGDFWLVWQAWFLSNALTGLTFLPLIVNGMEKAASWAWRPTWRRFLEGGLLLSGLLTIGFFVFVGPYSGESNLPARLYMPLPILLWAAVRFGPAGTSASLLVITSLTIWGALHGHGPFITQAPADNLLALQLFLLTITVPLMVLAALMAEREQESTQRERREVALLASYDQNKELTGRLIKAQETERARIARQLHDDVNQQLASLSIALSLLKRRLPEVATETQGQIVQLQQQTINLADGIRNLSHELHPTILHHAGLAATLKGSCAEFGFKHGTEVSVDSEDNLEGVSAEIALCLYRVAQEALRNVAAHAHPHHVRVTLKRIGTGLELTIADDRQGFDRAEAKQGSGLGQVSIEERVRLVGGSLRIASRPQWGTEIHVRVPLCMEGAENHDLESMGHGERGRQEEPLLSPVADL